MSEHLQNLPFEAIERNEKLTFPVVESNKSRFIGKLRYWWSLAFAGILLLFGALPAMIVLQIVNRRMRLYPLCVWGAKKWIRGSGIEV